MSPSWGRQKGGPGRKLGPVKVRESFKSPIYVDTAWNIWKVPQRALEASWPALLEECQRSGNRLHRPLGNSPMNLNSLNDRFSASLAWESALDILADRGRGVRNGPTWGPGKMSSLLQLHYNAAYFHSINGDIVSLDMAMSEAIQILSGVGAIFGANGPHGITQGLENDVLNIVLKFAPLAAQLSPYHMYNLILAMDIMSGGDQFIIDQMVNTIDGARKRELLTLTDFLVVDYQLSLAIRVGMVIRGIDYSSFSTVRVYLLNEFGISI